MVRRSARTAGPGGPVRSARTGSDRTSKKQNVPGPGRTRTRKSISDQDQVRGPSLFFPHFCFFSFLCPLSGKSPYRQLLPVKCHFWPNTPGEPLEAFFLEGIFLVSDISGLTKPVIPLNCSF